MNAPLAYAIGCLVGLLIAAPAFFLLWALHATELRRLQFADRRREQELARFMEETEQALSAQTFLVE